MRKSQERIQEKVENKMGTWIDWQYLLAAASLLAKVARKQTRGAAWDMSSFYFQTLSAGNIFELLPEIYT